MLIQEGQRWTFVNVNGERTEYIVESVESADAKGALAHLLNPKSGKHAHVTQHWLQEGRRNGRAHWLSPSVLS